VLGRARVTGMWDVSEEDLAKLSGELRRSLAKPPVLFPPLPRRVRLRLWLTHKVDALAIWLCDRRHATAAEWLYRLTGLWRG